jgi:hypothetical protein
MNKCGISLPANDISQIRLRLPEIKKTAITGVILFSLLAREMLREPRAISPVSIGRWVGLGETRAAILNLVRSAVPLAMPQAWLESRRHRFRWRASEDQWVNEDSSIQRARANLFSSCALL